MEKIKPRIRPSRPTDAKAIIELSLRSIRASYSSFLGEDAVETFIGSGAVEEFVSETIERGVVVTLGSDVAGYAVGNGNHIDQLVIDERFHRRGLGSILLAHLETQLFEEHDALQLESFRDNDQANAFYRQNGWQRTGEYRDRDYGVEMVVLRKEADRKPLEP